jgi:hypothetical protein
MGYGSKYKSGYGRFQDQDSADRAGLNGVFTVGGIGDVVVMLR